MSELLKFTQLMAMEQGYLLRCVSFQNLALAPKANLQQQMERTKNNFWGRVVVGGGFWRRTHLPQVPERAIGEFTGLYVEARSSSE